MEQFLSAVPRRARNLRFYSVRLFCLAAAAAACSSVAAETNEAGPYRGSGFATFGIGTCQHRIANISVSGGGDGFVWRGLAVGGEIGYFRFVERGSNGFGIGTLNVGYHFVDRKAPGKVEPLVSVGIVGAGFAPGAFVGAASLGGGANYWFKPKLGLRTEVRVYGMEGEAIVMFRVGLSFR